jgi:hypothetical protein
MCVVLAALMCACGKPDPVAERCGGPDKGEVADLGERDGFYVLCDDGRVFWVKR